MSFGGGQVDQPPLTQDEDTPVVVGDVFIHEWSHEAFVFGFLFQRWDVDLDIEMT